MGYFFKKLLLSLSTLLLLNSLFAQRNDDLQLWTKVSIEAGFNKLEFSLTEEFRFHENIQAIEEFYTDFGIDYKLFDFLEIGANYRIISEHIYLERYSNRHRFSTEIKAGKNIKRLNVSYRIRFQSKLNGLRYTESEDFYANSLRNKLKLKYNLKKSKFTPFTSVEVFNKSKKNTDFEYSKIRFTAGISYSKKKTSNINLFYRTEHSFHTLIPKNSYIIGISYGFKLN